MNHSGTTSTLLLVHMMQCNRATAFDISVAPLVARVRVVAWPVQLSQLVALGATVPSST